MPRPGAVLQAEDLRLAAQLRVLDAIRVEEEVGT